MRGEASTGAGELDGIKSEASGTFDWSARAPDGVVCPACWGELQAGAETLVCEACGRKYPVVDGIPVLISERAEQG
jgi:hypothetical protein